VVATTAVTIIPIVIVWLLLEDGVISSAWVSVALAIALSLAASFLGSAYWKRKGGHGDVFFSELLLWGWLHRVRSEQRLNSAVNQLGLSDQSHASASQTSVERQTELLRQMAAALDAQDPYTDGHSRRVALHSAMVARRMHVPRDEVAKILTAAAVHDIGKLRIPAEVLNKPEPLTSQEFEIVKRHADEGADIVSSLQDPEITAMVRHHHERFDGSGYPSGLLGEQTPLGARIIAVADTFDALTSVRPYRAAIPHKRALDVIAAASGTQLDPVVVRTFLKCYSANRATVFWTLLAISPSRAVALLRGRGPTPGSLASAGTVTASAVVAAVFGMTLGNSATLFTADPLGAAKPPPTASTRAAKPHPSSARAHRSAPATPPALAVAAVPPRRAVLAKKAVRHPRPPAKPIRSSVGAKQNPAKRGGAKPPTGKAAPRPPRHHPKPAPPKPTPSPSGGVSSNTPSRPPNATGDSGRPPVRGVGTPLAKRDCKRGGYAGHGFSNQGQCVADVERGPR
jgi:HD-GYP domain-containing protein (c-di-GMP phosphodiesterase class II)